MASKIPRVAVAHSNNLVSQSFGMSGGSASDKSCKQELANSKSKNANGKSKSSSSNRSSRNQHAQYANRSQKTMSYTQLKQEVGVLQEENCELRNKNKKQQNALLTLQKTTKNLQKENQDLEEHIITSEKKYNDSTESKTKEWTSRNHYLADKLNHCELKLEELGVDPVNMERLEECEDGQSMTQQREKAIENANILKQKLEDNIIKSQQQLTFIKDISGQCQLAMAELDG